MGPAFANLLEIGGDQYEYIQSVITHDFLWHTCSDHYHGSKVIDLQLKASFLIVAGKKARHRSQTVSSILKIQKRSLATKPFMPHFDINYIISKQRKESKDFFPCFHL